VRRVQVDAQTSEHTTGESAAAGVMPPPTTRFSSACADGTFETVRRPIRARVCARFAVRQRRRYSAKHGHPPAIAAHRLSRSLRMRPLDFQGLLSLGRMLRMRPNLMRHLQPGTDSSRRPQAIPSKSTLNGLQA